MIINVIGINKNYNLEWEIGKVTSKRGDITFRIDDINLDHLTKMIEKEQKAADNILIFSKNIFKQWREELNEPGIKLRTRINQTDYEVEEAGELALIIYTLIYQDKYPETIKNLNEYYNKEVK